MVGLVVVSHSRALAVAAVALASEMLHDRSVTIEVAAGLDETTFGTDAVAIAEALAAADSGDGVVVLMDLGSAVLSTELALDLLDDDALRDRVLLCPAPLVEGLVAAAVAAAGGATRAEIAEEATLALTPKETHLGTPPRAPTQHGPEAGPAAQTSSSSPAPAQHAPDAGVAGGAFTVVNQHGLHARPAARLVSRVRDFDARVELRNRTTGSPWVAAASLSRVATLGALRGHDLEARATGPDAEAAVEALVALAAGAFGEGKGEAESVAATEASAASSAALAGGGNANAGAGAGSGVGVSVWGHAASPGIGIGPARHLRPATPVIPDEPPRGVSSERARLDEALVVVRGDLGRLRDAGGAIFDAHLLLLDDPDLMDDVHARLAAGDTAPRAWSAATARLVAEFDALDDPYLRDRAADVRAVGDQVLHALLGTAPAAPPDDGVLIAADLTPAEAATLDADRVQGVLLAFGSPTSHGAILARTRGVPAVVGLGPSVLEIPDGTPVALDGGAGEVVVAPSAQVEAVFRRRAAALDGRREVAAARRGATAVTRDGVTIVVGANVGSLDDARAAGADGADMAGLVRTEFLFLGRDTAPPVDEQEAAYRDIAAALGGRRITLRTLDVGGDKPLRFLPAPTEANPFLGVRGLRHSFAHPHLLADQLLAVVRVARDVPVSVMFPMVSTVDEVIRARAMLDAAITRAGRGTPDGLHVGIMMEVPAAALKAAAFAPHVDFMSIGTNDLTQYALAAERGNTDLAALADGLDPGVLRLIDAVCRGAGDRVTVAVCGELAADETAVPLVAGLGVRELSVAPRAVPAVKEAVRAITMRDSEAAARRALVLPGAAEVRGEGESRGADNGRGSAAEGGGAGEGRGG